MRRQKRKDQNPVFNEQFKGNIERATNKIGRSTDQEIHQSVKIRMG
ncbi:hypothetical protein LEP1GSC103_0529 [Leptospira borgpetersenii serovar Javanica str. UI 09931]|uniref:Toxin-antitoxin system, antitoxin component, ribbon-helix-helix domain protein n=1 Tax=Leptospira borgpetersenii serovar Javanica str. UI 09931 TaxID=1049767 RepID=A0AAV3JFE7_LEPBO|nr:hypothetical protein LEP1GSC103_0529 [Leptospira borgpetersenii serovar Javanica str. UI 09931]